MLYKNFNDTSVLEAGLRKIYFISSYYFHTKLIINVLYK